LVGFFGVVAVMLLFAGTAGAMYNPVQGRFLQRDPVGVLPDVVTDDPSTAARVGSTRDNAQPGLAPESCCPNGINLYQYLGSMPISAVDPDGRILVILSGLFQHSGNGKPVGDKVGAVIANAMLQYDAGMQATVGVTLEGMGGKAEENRLRRLWDEFVERKQSDRCSLEQFVAIGHSDGATAIFRLINSGAFDGKDWTPAYLGLVDLVRRHWGFDPNMAGQANSSSHAILTRKPLNTYVENFWQENGGGWLFFDPKRIMNGRFIENADYNWNIGRLNRTIDHLTIWAYDTLHQILSAQASKYYEKAVRDEKKGGKWRREEGEMW
jgi:hypothetical protein